MAQHAALERPFGDRLGRHPVGQLLELLLVVDRHPEHVPGLGKLLLQVAGVPEADIEVARRVGCTKVNIDTDLRLAMTAAIRKAFAQNPKEFDPRKYLTPARNQVKELVRHKITDVLCCAGHAFD